MAPRSTATPASTKATLRFTNLISFLPAFVILLVHGIAANRAFPAVGLIPLFASALVSASILYRDHVAALGSPIQALSPTNIFFADVAIAMVDFLMLILSWATIASHWDTGLVVLGTYGTVFLMANLAIHAYFVISQGHIVQVNSACSCDHCVTLRHSQTGPTEYDPLSAGYDDLEDGEREAPISTRVGQ